MALIEHFLRDAEQNSPQRVGVKFRMSRITYWQLLHNLPAG
jgi:hypothetical protein